MTPQKVKYVSKSLDLQWVELQIKNAGAHYCRLTQQRLEYMDAHCDSCV